MAAINGLDANFNDEFKIVRHKKGKRRQKKHHVLPEKSVLTTDDDVVDVDSLKRRIFQCREEVVASEFYAGLRNTLEKAVLEVNGIRWASSGKLKVSPDDSIPQCSPHTDTSTDLSVARAVDFSPNSNTHWITEAALTDANRKGKSPDRQSTNRNGGCDDERQGWMTDSQRREAGHSVPETQLGTKQDSSKEQQSQLSMLVYGLGNFASCLIARYQLGLLLALRQHWKIEAADCQTYDPKFTEKEKHILQDLNCTVLQHNEEGKRCVDGVTVVLMSHCGKALFNNLLWANWSLQQLQKLVVIGNSFSAMLDSIPQRLWDQHIRYVAMIQPHTLEECVMNNFTHTDIFNDLSVHWFPPRQLRQMPADKWSVTQEPVYDQEDLEIILSSS